MSSEVERSRSGVDVPVLRVQKLCKSYAVPVLIDIDFDVLPGEVHALVGANGAGKSTLARIISGLTHAESGQMQFDGRPYAPPTKLAAEQAGVSMVRQELNLIGTLSVAENLYLNRLPRRYGFIDYNRLARAAHDALETVGLRGLDPSTPVNRLGVGKQQLVEIAAALARSCRLLILDEPTAALTEPEIELLFERINRLKQKGTGIIYISHRMEEILRIADRVTILRDGCNVITRPVQGFKVSEIVRLMVGRDVIDTFESDRRPSVSPALRVRGLTRGEQVRDVSFEVRRGEILGIAGLVGSGRTELLRAIFGADRPDAGAVYLGDNPEPVRINSPRDAVRAGLGLVPEDRKEHGLLLTQPLRMNVTLARLRAVVRRHIWIDTEKERKIAGDLSRNLDIQAHLIEQRAIQLSGGNQQKIVLAKWLMRECDVLLFDEPTRGIDVAAKWTVYQLMNDLAARGKAIVMVSSEMQELMSLCDRIAVMSAGKLVKVFDRGTWSQEVIMDAALSGYLNRTPVP